MNNGVVETIPTCNILNHSAIPFESYVELQSVKWTDIAESIQNDPTHIRPNIYLRRMFENNWSI